MAISYDEFKKIVKKEFGKSEIEKFAKTSNGYGVYVFAYGEKEIEDMCDDLRKHGFECKWWHSSDPDDDDSTYLIEAIPLQESKKYVRKSLKESKGSINFGDLLSSQIDHNKDDDNVLYYIFVNNKEYGSFFKWEIYNDYRELLQLDVFRWDIESKGVLRVNLH